MIKTIRVLGLMVLLMLIFSGTAAAFDSNHRDVWVTDDGETTKYKTTLLTIEELFTKEGIVIEDKDLVNVDLDGNLKHGLRIEIKRGVDIKLLIGDKIIAERAHQGVFVSSVVHQRSKEDGVEYVYDGDLNEMVYDGMRLRLHTQTTETVVVTEPVPYETAQVETEDLVDGATEVVVEGQDGAKEVSMLVTYFNGKETVRELVGETVIREPVNEVVHVGIGRDLGMRTDVENLNYARELLVVATAYTTGHDGVGTRTASGMKTEYGLVSVDPDVIPLGTELYVEGYGYAIAADTGGAIKGNKIDLYFNSYEECMRFGRRELKVYVLE